MLNYRERPAPAGAARDVECVWAVWDARAAGGRAAERIVPDGCPEIIVHLADPFARRVGEAWRVQPRAFLAGTLTRPWLVRPGRRALTVGIRFRAAGAAARLGASLAGTADREVPLERLVGRAAGRALVAGLRGASSVEARLDLAAAWVSARPPGDAAARAAVELVLAERGRVRVDELARRLGWTARRLQRAFAHDLGVPPKVYIRIVRLNAVLAALAPDARARAVEVALEAGYFDQSHLLRDFRFLAGRLPTAPSDADGEMARHFTRRERLLALLGE